MLVGLVIALQLANPDLQFQRRVAVLRAPASAAHQRGDLRLRRQRHLHGRLLLHAAAAARRGCSPTRSAGSTSGAGRPIIVAAAITLPLGFTQAKEYAELEWPIDIAIAVVWVVFAVNFFGTLVKRRERHLYVAIWFYIATIVTVAMLHIFNNLSIPAGLFKSYSHLRRRAGRVHAVVVRAQRGGLLPDDAVPRADVLLPAQGGRAAGLLATGCRSCTSGRWSSSTSGPARTTCTTRRCPSGPRRSACSSR